MASKDGAQVARWIKAFAAKIGKLLGERNKEDERR